MSLPFTGITRTVGSTEESLVAGAPYSTSTAQSSKGYLDVDLDLSTLARGDRVQIAGYEKVNGGTQLPMFEPFVVEGPFADRLYLRDLFVGEAWDLTGKKLAGTDRALRASSRMFAPQNPALAGGTATIGATRFSLPNASTILTPQTTDRRLQVWLDLADFDPDSVYLLLVWDAVNGGTAAPLYRARLRGRRGHLWTSRTFIVGEAWDVTLERLAGADCTIPWSIRTDDGATSGQPAFPALTNATTEDAIRDRAIAVLHALAPEIIPGTKFREYRSEGEGDFVDWCEDNPASSLRRFQVRFTGRLPPPEVTNNDHEERFVTLQTIVAYPHNARTGARQALDRDTAISRDEDLLHEAIGLYSRPNFVAPYPDACWRAGDIQRIGGGANDFLVATGTFSFRRSL